MSIAKSIAMISSSWGGLVVKKKDSLGQDKFYGVVFTCMFGGWTYSGKREDEYFFPFTNEKYEQIVNAKEKRYKKGEIYTVFLVDFTPENYVDYDCLLTKEDMMKRDLIEGDDVFGVKCNNVSVMGTRTRVSKIKYPIVRKGCISVITPCYNEMKGYLEYYVDIAFKTVDGGGIFYYVKEEGKEKLIGISKEIVKDGLHRDTIYYDLSKVTFIDEAKDLILYVEKENTVLEVEEDHYSIDESEFKTDKKKYEVDF